MALNITLLIGVLGFLPLFIFLWKRSRINKIKKHGDLVTGTILEVYEFRGYKGSVYYKAVIEDPVFNQAPIQGQFPFAGKKGLSTYYKGKRIEIFYDKNKPKKFVPKEYKMSTGILIFTLLTALFVVFAAFKIYHMLETGSYE